MLTKAQGEYTVRKGSARLLLEARSSVLRKDPEPEPVHERREVQRTVVGVAIHRQEGTHGPQPGPAAPHKLPIFHVWTQERDRRQLET